MPGHIPHESTKVIGLGDQVVDQYVNKNVMYPGGNALNFAAFAKKLGYEIGRAHV